MCRITISVLFMAVSFIGRSNQIYKEEITNLAEITESTNFIPMKLTAMNKTEIVILHIALLLILF
jgi:hypothetical protein